MPLPRYRRGLSGALRLFVRRGRCIYRWDVLEYQYAIVSYRILQARSSIPMAPTTGKAYDRRWWTLAVLAMSLLVISLDNTILNVALPTHRARARRLGGRPAVDRRRIHARIRGSAADHGQPRRPLRSRGVARHRAGRVRRWLAAVGACHSADKLIASRAADGYRRRADHARHPVDPHQRVPDAEERPKAIGIWAAVAGLGIGDRTGCGRLADRALRLGLGVLRQPARSWPSRWPPAPALVPESRDAEAPPGSTRWAPCSRWPGSVCSLGDHRGGGERGWTDGAALGGFGVGARGAGGVRVPGSCALRPMLDVRCSPTRASAARSVSIALVFFALFGAIFLLTSTCRRCWVTAPLEAGLRVTPIAAGLVLGGPSCREAGRAARNAQRGGRRADDRGRCDAAAGLRPTLTRAMA